MSNEAFSFSADGTAGPFFGPASIIIGDDETFGGGSITVMLDGGTSNYTSKTITAPGETKVNSRCGFMLVMAGSTAPNCSGLVWNDGVKAL